MHGLYLLWWVGEQELSPAVVAAILAAGDLALVAVELPTGWFADRYGHRTSLIIGSAVQAVGMLWCWLGSGVPALLTASVLIALGDGFRSGADQALLYRSCHALGRADTFQVIESRTRAIEGFVLAGLVVAGGAIVSRWGFAAGWIAETLLSAAGLGLACAMSEPPPVGEPEGEPDVPSASHPAFSVTLAALIVPAALVGAVASAASFLAQTGGTVDPLRLTVLVAAITLAEAAGSAVAAMLPGGTVRGQLVLGATAVALAALGLRWPPAFDLVVLLLAFVAGVAAPLRATAIQRWAADRYRARTASLASAVDMVVSTIALPLAGIWRSR